MLCLKDHDEGYEDDRRPYDYRESSPEWDDDMYKVSFTFGGCPEYNYSCSFMVSAYRVGRILYNGVFCSISRCRKGGLIGSMINWGKRNNFFRRLNTRRCTTMAGGDQSGGEPWPWSISLTRHPSRRNRDASKINPFWTGSSC